MTTLPGSDEDSSRTTCDDNNGQTDSAATTRLHDRYTAMFFACSASQTLIPLLVFAGIVAGHLGRAVDDLQPQQPGDGAADAALSRPQSLAEIEDPTQARRRSARCQGLTDAAKSLSRPLMPQTELEQNALKTKLANAGFRCDAAPMVYSGMRIVVPGRLLLIGLAVFVPGRPLGWQDDQGSSS